MDDKRVPQGMWCYLISDSQVLLGAALNDGGSLYQWICDNFVLSEDGKSYSRSFNCAHSLTIDFELVDQMEACSHGLKVLPFLRGKERFYRTTYCSNNPKI